MDKDYGVGLDIGTGSVGFSVVDDNAKLMRIKGTHAIGVRLYNEAEKAEDRRGFRTARRRLSRRRWRLNFLREFFDRPISQVDPDFFAKLKYYYESPKDEQTHGLSKSLFDKKTNSEFAHEYPTIYHLRRALMTEHRKFDVREIYLAIHHIVKYRGHFLNSSPTSQFANNKINYGAKIADLSNSYSEILGEDDFSFGVSAADLKQQLLAQNLRPSDRAKELQSSFTVPLNESEMMTSREIKELKARNKNIAKEISNALSGLTVRMDVLLQIDVEKEAQSEWKTTLATIEDFLAIHDTDIETEAQLLIVSNLRELYADAYLTGSMPKGISARMIELYERHASDLAQYKRLARRQSKSKRDELLQLYSEYINGKASKPVAQDVFFELVKKAFKGINDPDASDILQKIEVGTFMPKPRSKENALIPHQMQQQELDLIINNQKGFYPWLAEINPVEAHLANQPFKLDELVSFRVPYYTGPLIKAADQKKTSNAKFAWMERKEAGDITPWNFDEKVDRTASATNFIERMKTTDTYLMGANVLPASSLLYQKFTVLNELNNVRVNGEHLSTEQKDNLIGQYFARQTVVKKTDLVNYLRANSFVAAGSEPDIQGLADPNKFNSKMSTYRDLSKIIPEAVNEPSRLEDIEKIIEWSTLFEDTHIFMDKLAEISWLNENQRRKLAAKRYRGWGQLSAELLDGIKNNQGQTIIDVLATTSKNFMQIVKDADFASKIEQHNNNAEYTVNEIIDNAYTSPSNRKALRQVLAVLEDIERAVGNAPKYVYIEAADGLQTNPQRTTRRQDALLETYEKNAEILSREVFSELKARAKNQFNDKLVLYFSQNGRDAYTDDVIDINQLGMYDIDHIIPQSFVKDNSLDNRVLTSKTENEKHKEAGFAIDNYPNMAVTWNSWRKVGIITERKYKNLMLHERDFDKRANGFIARQLVETRQIIKLTQQVLQVKLPKESAIISIKADLSHDFRDTFDFPKNREVNDYHHAFDAHLAAFIGTYLRKQLPQYQSMFEYGKFDMLRNQKKTMRKSNFVYDLAHSERKVNVDGELTWDKKRDLIELNKIYEYKTMLVSYETYEYSGALNDQTRWKAADAAVNGGSKSKLIPAAKNKPVELYGGFSGSKTSYLAIAKFKKKNEDAYRVIPVLVRDVSRLERARQISKETEIAVLTEIANPLFEKTNNKGVSRKIPFEIVIPHVELGTVFQNQDKGTFRLVSDTEYRNTVQLWMSKREIKLITRPHNAQQWQHYTEPTKEELLEIFDNIIDRELKSNPLLKLKIQGLTSGW